MLSHLRTIERSAEKKELCFQKISSQVEKRQVENLLELLSKTVTTSPSPSPEFCEDDSQEVKKFPSLEELIHNSDEETSDASEQVEAPQPAEAEEAPRSNLKDVRQRAGKLSGSRGGPKNQTKLHKKPAAKAAPKSAAKEDSGSAAPRYRVGKYSNKGYVQFLDTDQKWKLLVNVDYSNCSEDWKLTCHAVLDKLLEHAEKHQSSKDELRNLRDELLGVEAKPVAKSKTKKSKKPAASAAARASPVKKRPGAAPSAAGATASSDEAVSDHPLLGSQDKLSPGKGMTVALSFSAFGSFK